MTQQTINIGTGPDSYTGDNLRTAFQKINENFSQLYAGNVGGNVIVNTITANNLISNSNITAGNITALTSLISQGNITGAYLIGNGSLLTGVTANASLGNLSITGINQQTIAGISDASMFFAPFVGRSIVFQPRTSSNIQSNLSISSFTSNTINFGTDKSLVITSPNLNLYSTGNLTIGANSSFPGVSTTGLLKINYLNGHMGFNTFPSDGYDFTFRGDLFANSFYAAENIVTGYSFATPNGLTGMNHVYQNDVHGNVSVVRISHDNTVPAKFYENNHTILSGNLVVSQFGNVFGAGFPDAFVQIYSNVDSYSQFLMQNFSSNALASTDLVVTADNGNDSAYYGDFGIASSNANAPGYSLVKPYDVYLMAVGANDTGPGSSGYSNLIIGSTNGNIVMFVGAPEDANVIARLDTTGFVPGANVTYNLGSATRQWKDLWISNNTLYLGGTPITVANGVLSVNGSVVSGNYSNANVAAYLPTYTGNISSSNISTSVITLTNGAVIKDNAGDSVAFGQSAGATSQGNSAVAIGHNAGVTSQGTFTVAIGRNAGQTSQGGSSVAVGVSAGDVSQGAQAVAVGNGAGFGNQGNSAVAIGVGAGQSTQGIEAVAIGNSAGSLTQGISAIAIGKGAGRNFQGNNSIIINATGADLDQTTANTFTVAPVRNDVANVAEILFYNTTSKEVTYGNTISIAGNVSANNFIGNITFPDTSVQTTAFTGNAATIDVTNTNGIDTNYSITFVESRSASQELRADVDLTFNSATNLLTVGSISLNGDISGNTAGFAIGYRDIPQVVFTSNATLALTDAGKHYFSSNSANVITVPNNTTVSFNIGTAISIIQQGTGNLTVTPGSGVTMYLAGNSTSSSRTVGNYGMATLMKVGTDTWFINGTGVN